MAQPHFAQPHFAQTAASDCLQLPQHANTSCLSFGARPSSTQLHTQIRPCKLQAARRRSTESAALCLGDGQPNKLNERESHPLRQGRFTQDFVVKVSVNYTSDRCQQNTVEWLIGGQICHMRFRFEAISKQQYIAGNRRGDIRRGPGDSSEGETLIAY
jgi:hypothetical protein